MAERGRIGCRMSAIGGVCIVVTVLSRALGLQRMAALSLYIALATAFLIFIILFVDLFCFLEFHRKQCHDSGVSYTTLTHKTMEHHTAGQETLTLKSCDQNIIVYDNSAVVGTGNGKGTNLTPSRPG